MASASAWLEAIGRHAASRAGGRAIVEVAPGGTREWTWEQLWREIGVRASIVGDVVRPGETLVVCLASGLELAAWFAGAVAAGVRLALMHPKSGAGEFASVCGRVGARAVLAEEALLGRVRPDVARLSREVLDGARSHWSGAAGVAPGSIVLGSSGTTGLPKLAVRESEALDADAVAVVSGLGLTPSDRVLCIPPLCHSYGVDLFLGATSAGATLLVMTEFDPARAAHELRSGVTVLPGVPFVFEALTKVGGGGASSVRLAVSAGWTLADRVREEFTRAWGIEIGQLYGATELGTVAIGVPGSAGFEPRSIGDALGGVSIRVLDVDNPSRRAADGAEGQIAVRAPSMLSRYVDGEVALEDGHWLTGDLGRRDSAGRTTITGRLKLLIESGGFKVNPLEVEGVLGEHPEVKDCAVVALPLSDTIQRVLAFVVPRDEHHPPTDRELRTYLRERLAATKVPRSFRMVHALPRTRLGKLLREHLPRVMPEEDA